MTYPCLSCYSVTGGQKPRQERSVLWLWLANLNHTSQCASLAEWKKLWHIQTCYPHHSSGFGFLLLRVCCLAGMLG